MIFVEINEQALYGLAEEIFFKTSGINKQGNKFQRMREDALKTYKKIRNALDIKGVYHYFNEFELIDKKLIIDNKVFECNAFENLNQKNIKGVYIYALSVEGSNFSEGSIMEQLYADIWGSAFVDAARIIIKQDFEIASRLSKSFGPGFYGMKLTQIEDLYNLLDMDSIGIEIRSGSIMLPLKSCAGMYFDVTDSYEEIKDACVNCLGNQTSCKLCNVYRGVK